MLGTFMKGLTGDSELKLEAIYPFAAHHLPAGLPLVAVENLETLRDNGLPTGMRFGIATTNRQIIRQECQCTNMEQPEFEVIREELKDFCPDGWKLVVPEANGQGLDLPQIHSRAVREIGTCYQVLRSYPGDDFVSECVTGTPASSLCRTYEAIGQHWRTPLYYNVEELQTELSNTLRDKFGISLSLRQPPANMNVEVLHFQHHGILIEDNWVIHFARCRVPDNSNQIKLDTLDTFCNITPYAEPGGPCDYKEDTEFKRLLHRNRAVWILFHAKEWGSYNLFTNNCEHMSRACKVGRKQSAQVMNGVARAALTALSFLLPGRLPARIAIALGGNILFKEAPKQLRELLTGTPKELPTSTN